MVQSISSGEEKVKKICEALKKETLDPARKEADAIIELSREEAKRLIDEAKQDARHLHDEARRKIEEDRNVFQASIHLACKKSLETLKQEIEKKLFDQQLSALLEKPLKDPQVIAELISAIVRGVEKDGLDADLRAIIPAHVSAKAVNEALLKGVIEKLKSGGVELGEITGGAEVKIVDQNITIDMTADALKSLVAEFIRDDFRSIVFQPK